MNPVSPSRRAHLAVECLEDRRVLSTISGYVFNDLNNNGRFDTGESPVAGSNLELRNSAGKTIATAVSNANGFYQFTTDSTISTAPATRTVVATFAPAKTGWNKTVQVAKFNPLEGTLLSIDFINTPTMQSEIALENLDDEAGTIDASLTGNLTLTIPGTNSLTTKVTTTSTFDADAYDGSTDFDGDSGFDSGIVSQTGSKTSSTFDAAVLQQFVGTGTVAIKGRATSQSSLSGPGNLQVLMEAVIGGTVSVVYHYVPSDALRAGDYTIVQTSQPDGYLPGLKSSEGNVIPNSVNTNSISVSLPTNTSNSTDNNFAELLPATASGFVYVDANNNGIKDSGETTGISGVTVVLSGSNDLGTITPVTTHSVSGGAYSFGNLRPGTYTVTQTSQTPGYLTGMKTRGNVSPIPNSASAPDAISGISVTPGSTAANNNFGKLQASKLSGRVYVDLNKNGVRDSNEPPIGNTKITLTGTNDLGSVSIVVQADSNGNYTFNNLRPGDYTITETQPTNFQQGTNTLGQVNGITRGSKGTGDQFFVSLGQAEVGQNYDYGELLPPAQPQVVPQTPPKVKVISKSLLLTTTIHKLYK